MTIALDPRSQKALAIAAEAGQWTRLPTGAYVIPSQSEPGTSYRVTPQSCSCPDSDRHPERLCKHSVGLILYLTLADMDTPPAPPAPLSDVEVSALFAQFLKQKETP